MRVLGLPCVAELGYGSLLALGDEHGVESEALVAAWLERDLAFQSPCSPEFTTFRRERDELADVARRSVSLAGEGLQSPPDVLPGRPAGGLDARPSAEGAQLEARVLAQHPLVRRTDPPAVLGLRARVLQERLPHLGWVVVHVEQLDLPARKDAL